jgi:hypothetical protein
MSINAHPSTSSLEEEQRHVDFARQDENDNTPRPNKEKKEKLGHRRIDKAGEVRYQ